jgi:hypothetical protein
MICARTYPKARWVSLAGLFLAGMLVPRAAWSQSSWPSFPNNTAISVTSGGNVGIRTANPIEAIDVAGHMRLGYEIDNGDAWLYARSNQTSFGASSILYIGNGTQKSWNSTAGANGGAMVSLWSNGSFGPGNLNFYGGGTTGNISFITSDSTRMMVTAAGNVGIGTTTPQYRLAVNGTIGTKEVVVTNTGWADYVFQPGYRLRPLGELKAYIGANRRLPGVPSEAEVKEKGIGVGEMQAKLLAKIEELTLHVIQQNEDSQQLRDRIAVLETRMAGGSKIEGSDAGRNCRLGKTTWKTLE